MNTKPYDLVIFDCDGVLVESEALACQIYVQLFSEYGQPLDYTETLHKFYGVTLTNRLKVSGEELGWTPPDEFVPLFNVRLLALSERESIWTCCGIPLRCLTSSTLITSCSKKAWPTLRHER